MNADEIRAHSSSKRPSVQPGEPAILYAAVWQAVFAVVEIAGPSENDPAGARWSWRFPIRPLVVVPDLHHAPPVEAAGIFPQSLWRHSHIRLTNEQFAAARALIERAASGEEQHWPLAAGELECRPHNRNRDERRNGQCQDDPCPPHPLHRL